MDPKNTTFQNASTNHPTLNHLLSLGNQPQSTQKLNATYAQRAYNQRQVDLSPLQAYLLKYEGTSPTSSTPVMQRQMALKAQTENHLPRNKPSSLHAFLESSANNPPVTWLNKEHGILKVNNWSLTEAQWKQNQRQQGVLNPSDLHNALCDSEDIDFLSDQQYKLSLYKTELVTKMATTRASRHQHVPYNIPERLKGSEHRLSPDSSSTGVNITKPTQDEIASSPQMFGCTFLARQADIGKSITWIDKARGALKVINPEQLSKAWLLLQQQYNVVNGETLQDALKKESELNDIQCLGLTAASEIIFQLNYKHYSADTASSVKNNQTIALSTSKQANTYTNPPQDPISTLTNTKLSMPGDVLDVLKAQPWTPIVQSDDRQIPLGVQSAKTAEPINPVYKAPKSCEG